ncbi:MAG: succinate--CoA ligase subunit beta, partial [Candidatus Dadabacteria bacterium]|nr:succinate--CoA ligase subunit beta [Candidatus Dadabacteria bacterium]
IVVMASRAGGMDIEEVAASEPEKIHTFFINPILGVQEYQCRKLGFELDLNDVQRKHLSKTLHGLYS